MKVTTEKPEPGVAALTVEVPAEEYDRAVDGAWKRLANRVNIPGFRRGKAPRPLVERHVGQAAIDDEAIRALLPKQYDAAIEETGLLPIDRPSFEVVEFERGKPLIFKATVPLRPTTELGDFASLTIEPESVVVDEEEIGRVIERLRESQAQWLPVEDRGVEMGDQVIANLTIQFPPKEDDPDKQGANTEREDTEIVLGENGYPKGFDDQLLGAKSGDTREFELSWEIPASPNAPSAPPVEAPAEKGAEAQAGAPGEPVAEVLDGATVEVTTEPPKEERRATFTAAVKDVKRKQVPEIDDSFARSVGEYESVDAMQTDIRRRLYGEALRAARANTENKSVDAAIQKTNFEIPARLIEAETDSLVQERSRSLAEQRITVERYLQIMGTSQEDWRAELRQQAERQLKARLILDQLAERDGIEVNPSQVEEEIERTAMQYREQADQVRRSLRATDGRRRVTTSLRRHMAIQRLVEAAGGYPEDELGVMNDQTAGESDETAKPAEMTAPDSENVVDAIAAEAESDADAKDEALVESEAAESTTPGDASAAKPEPGDVAGTR